MRVDEVLRAKGSTIVSVAPSATLLEAAEILRVHRIGAVLVLDANEQVRGILSERDIVSSVATKGSDALASNVSDAMSSDVVTCSPKDSLEQLMLLMTEHRIRHLPVVDAGSLVGVISIGDVVKNRISEVADEAKALTDYITMGR